MIKVIIFDFDGVLIDSINNMKFAWKNSCKKCGIKTEHGAKQWRRRAFTNYLPNSNITC